MHVLKTGLVAVLALATVSLPARGQDPAGRVVAFVDVGVIPMDRDRLLEHQTVVVEGERIRALGPVATVAVPSGATVVDGAGRYLMPGLADLHTHLRDDGELLCNLAWGVTTVMHMGGSADRGRELLDARQRIRSGEMTGPNIYATERIVDGDPPLGTHQSIATPEAARQKVAELKSTGFDFVKIYNNVSLEVFGAVIEEADRQHLPVFGHIPRGFDPMVAITGGEDAIAHTEEFFFTYFGGPRSTKDMDRTYRPDVALIPALVQALGENHVAVMPDLCFTFTDLVMWDDLQNVWTDPEMQYLHPDTVLDWHAGSINRRDEIENFVFREQIKYGLLQELTRRFQAGGVLQVIGTDASLPGIFPGEAAHRELTELVKAGLDNYDALAIGTRNAGEFVRRYIDADARFGQIVPGFRADLVLVEKNPIDDVRNARLVSGVVVAGRWYSREDLDARREALAGRYAEMGQVTDAVTAALDGPEMETTVRAIVQARSGDVEIMQLIENALNASGYAAAQNDLEHAREILALATRVFPESANAWDSLAEITLMTGDRKGAIALYERALEVDPDFPSSRSQLRKLQSGSDD